MRILPCVLAELYTILFFVDNQAGAAPAPREDRLETETRLCGAGAAWLRPPPPIPIKIKIACTATSDCASAMIATYDGIFAKHGLDAEMTLIGINTNIPPAIASDSIQIGGPTSPCSCKPSTAASISSPSPAPP